METIKSRKEFEKVFRQGERYNSPLLRIRIAQIDEGSSPKLAFVAPKKLGNAVFRNRCKRVLREAARSCNLPLNGYNIILFACRDTYGATPAMVARTLSGMLNRGKYIHD